MLRQRFIPSWLQTNLQLRRGLIVNKQNKPLLAKHTDHSAIRRLPLVYGCTDVLFDDLFILLNGVTLNSVRRNTNIEFACTLQFPKSVRLELKYEFESCTINASYGKQFYKLTEGDKKSHSLSKVTPILNIEDALQTA